LILEETHKDYVRRINDVLEYINLNLTKKISLKELASVANFSEFHFHRIFTYMMNETPGEFLCRIRLEQAAGMLINMPKRPIIDIATEAGFDSPSSFSRAFKSKFGISAKEWRNSTDKEKLKRSLNEKIKNNENADAMIWSVNYHSYLASGKVVRHVEIEEVPSERIFYLSVRDGLIAEAVGEAMWKVIRFLEDRPDINKETAKFYGINFDNPDITEQSKCRFYAGVAVPPYIDAEDEFGIYNTHPGVYMIAHYYGTVDKIMQVYKDMFLYWMPKMGYEPELQPTYEIYHKDPYEPPVGYFDSTIFVPVRKIK
jgi:AraC family transcriptional regulator